MRFSNESSTQASLNLTTEAQIAPGLSMEYKYKLNKGLRIGNKNGTLLINILASVLGLGLFGLG